MAVVLSVNSSTARQLIAKQSMRGGRLDHHIVRRGDQISFLQKTLLGHAAHTLSGRGIS